MMQNRSLSFALACTAVCAATLVVAPQKAQAVQWTIEETAPQSRPMSIDVTSALGFNWVGLAAWFAYPIVPEGFIPKLNDSFDIEVGAFLNYYFAQPKVDYLGLSPLAGVKWQFHLTPDWTVFAAAKLGVNIGLGANVFHINGGGSVGAYWKARENIYVRLESGYPGGLMAGVSLPL